MMNEKKIYNNHNIREQQKKYTFYIRGGFRAKKKMLLLQLNLKTKKIRNFTLKKILLRKFYRHNGKN